MASLRSRWVFCGLLLSVATVVVILCFWYRQETEDWRAFGRLKPGMTLSEVTGELGGLIRLILDY